MSGGARGGAVWDGDGECGKNRGQCQTSGQRSDRQSDRQCDGEGDQHGSGLGLRPGDAPSRHPRMPSGTGVAYLPAHIPERLTPQVHAQRLGRHVRQGGHRQSGQQSKPQGDGGAGGGRVRARQSRTGTAPLVLRIIRRTFRGLRRQKEAGRQRQAARQAEHGQDDGGQP